MSKFGELVLIAGDSFLPYGASDIPEQFKKMFIPGKFRHVILTGNICSEKETNFFKSICEDVSIVRGPMEDSDSNPERLCKEICGYKILVVNGSSLLVDATDVLLISTAERLKCDIAVYGSTHKATVQKKGKTLFLNPGSLTGAFHSINMTNNPSFLLLAMQPEEITVFTYQIKDNKLDVSKALFKKNE